MGNIAEILELNKEKLQELEEHMQEAGFERALEQVEKENNKFIQRALRECKIKGETAEEVREALLKKAEEGDE